MVALMAPYSDWVLIVNSFIGKQREPPLGFGGLDGKLCTVA